MIYIYVHMICLFITVSYTACLSLLLLIVLDTINKLEASVKTYDDELKSKTLQIDKLSDENQDLNNMLQLKTEEVYECKRLLYNTLCMM